MDFNSQPLFLTTIWLLFAIIVLIGNVITTFIIWRRKISHEKSTFGLKCHAAFNLLGINIAYSLLGLTLTVTSITRLAKDGDISKTACKVLGFIYAFFFHFAAFGVMTLQTDKLYCLSKPFVCHVFSRRKSKIPLIVLVCCALYGTVMSVLPLIKLGKYCSKTGYTNCLPLWNRNGAFYASFFLKFILFLSILVAILGTVRQKFKTIRKRREMKVATSHSRETIIFVLAVSIFFVVCWSPNLIAMFASIFLNESQPGDQEKAVLFGITLIPQIFNPVVTLLLRVDCRELFIEYWSYINEYFTAKRAKKSLEQYDVKTTCTCAVALEMRKI